MKINVQHIAKLANLPLGKDEEEKFAKQLADVLEHIEKLSEVSVEDVEETSQVTGLTNVDRDDIPYTSLTQEAAIGQAKISHNGLFAVPVIIEEAVEE